MTIGEEGLGDHAREQLDAARRDRRLDRGHGAMIDDFGLAVEEAERTRAMSRIGLVEVKAAYERERADFEEHGGDEGREHEVQVFWQRAEFATVESEVEHLAPALRDPPFEISMRQAEDRLPHLAAKLTPRTGRV
jgi:hypothetical protein